MRRQNILPSDFYCTQCGHYIPLVRKSRKQKEPGHLKKIYCIQCKKETNHAEVKSKGDYTYNDFWAEFTYGNFTPNGERLMTYRQFEAQLRQKGVI